jgi:hypothetical protein
VAEKGVAEKAAVEKVAAAKAVAKQEAKVATAAAKCKAVVKAKAKAKAAAVAKAKAAKSALPSATEALEAVASFGKRKRAKPGRLDPAEHEPAGRRAKKKLAPKKKVISTQNTDSILYFKIIQRF